MIITRVILNIRVAFAPADSMPPSTTNSAMQSPSVHPRAVGQQAPNYVDR